MNDPQGPVLIFGAWYLGEVAAEIFELTDQPVLGFVDPEPAEHLKTVDVFPEDASAFVAIGTNPIREYVCNRLLAHSRRLKSIFIQVPSSVLQQHWEKIPSLQNTPSFALP